MVVVVCLENSVRIVVYSVRCGLCDEDGAEDEKSVGFIYRFEPQ